VLDGGGWSIPHSSHFTPRKDPVLVVWGAGWAPEPVWTKCINVSEEIKFWYLEDAAV